MLSDAIRIRLNEEQLKKLQDICRKTGLNRSDVLRILIDQATFEIIAFFPKEEQIAHA